jgi:hypothetical protein
MKISQCTYSLDMFLSQKNNYCRFLLQCPAAVKRIFEIVGAHTAYFVRRMVSIPANEVIESNAMGRTNIYFESCEHKLYRNRCLVVFKKSKELDSLRLHVLILSNSFEIKTLRRPRLHSKGVGI